MDDIVVLTNVQWRNRRNRSMLCPTSHELPNRELPVNPFWEKVEGYRKKCFNHYVNKVITWPLDLVWDDIQKRNRNCDRARWKEKNKNRKKKWKKELAIIYRSYAKEHGSSWNLLVNLVQPWPIVTQSKCHSDDRPTQKWLFTILWILWTILIWLCRRYKIISKLLPNLLRKNLIEIQKSSFNWYFLKILKMKSLKKGVAKETVNRS